MSTIEIIKPKEKDHDWEKEWDGVMHFLTALKPQAVKRMVPGTKYTANCGATAVAVGGRAKNPEEAGRNCPLCIAEWRRMTAK